MAATVAKMMQQARFRRQPPAALTYSLRPHLSALAAAALVTKVRHQASLTYSLHPSPLATTAAAVTKVQQQQARFRLQQ